MLTSESNTNRNLFKDARVDRSSEGEYEDSLIDTPRNITE